MALETFTQPSLIQGISQQAIIARARASCEDQENCLNDVLDGVVSRMGTSIIYQDGTTYDDPFVHNIVRSDTERYVVIIEGGEMKVINLVSGALCSVSGSLGAYGSVPSAARRSFRALTVGDTTFILNRTVAVAESATKTAPRSDKGCFFFRAGGYMQTYSVRITVAATVYTATYTTPDNSVPGNAAYIRTDELAQQFLNALNSTTFPAILAAGHGTFTATRYGSTVVITATGIPGGGSWDLYTVDGVGDTALIGFKDTIKNVSMLPAKCQSGYQVMVRGDGSPDDTAYFLQFSGNPQTGKWSEIPAPDTKIGLDATTMPRILVNTGLNTFTLSTGAWGARLAGDGVNTSKPPSFVGKLITSLQYIKGRLALTTSYTATMSRSRNAFVFYPDTAQTALDTDPIDYDISNGATTAIVHTVVAGGALQFWGDKQQTRLETNQEALKEKTTDVPPMSNYDYDGVAAPEPVGMSSLLHCTLDGRWAKVTETLFRAGQPQGEIVLTTHVPRLVEGAVRYLATGGGGTKVLVLGNLALNNVYLYQSYNQGPERIQSAWNRWTFPAPTRVMAFFVIGQVLYLLLKWGPPFVEGAGGFSIEKVSMDGVGDDTAFQFPIRMDHRLTEANGVWDGTRHVITLPFSIPAEKRSLYSACDRLDVEDLSERGRNIPIEWVSGTSVRVLTSAADHTFHFGVVPVAKRTETKFLPRDANDQPVFSERCVIAKYEVAHKQAYQYSVDVRKRDTSQQGVQTFFGRQVGDPVTTNSSVPERSGTFTAEVKAATEDVSLTIVNDTPYPCVWTATKLTFDLTKVGR